MSTQLSLANDYETSNMVFSSAKISTIPDKDPTKPPMKFRRIMISTKNPDGTVGELVTPTEEVFSFGISENTDKKTGEVNGFSFPLVLHSKEGATAAEIAWCENHERIVERCKDHLVSVAREIGDPKLQKSDLRKFGRFTYKKDQDGIPDEMTAPNLYPTIYCDKKTLTIQVNFYDMDGNPLDAETLKNTKDQKHFCTTVAAVHYHSIYIGGTGISLQVKLYEANVKPVGQQKKRLLGRPEAEKRVFASSSHNPLADGEPEEGEKKGEPVKKGPSGKPKKAADPDPEDGEGSLKGSGDEAEVVVPAAKPKAAVPATPKPAAPKRVVVPVVRKAAGKE